MKINRTNTMIPLNISLDLDKTPWIDLKTAAEPGLGKVTRIGRLPAGMQSGKSTIAIVITTPDGKQFIGETSMALFLAAARAMKAIESEMSGENQSN